MAGSLAHEESLARSSKLAARGSQLSYATFAILMGPNEPEAAKADATPPALYCPQCAREVTDPLTCGDCAAVICRQCGSPLESPDELGIG